MAAEANDIVRREDAKARREDPWEAIKRSPYWAMTAGESAAVLDDLQRQWDDLMWVNQETKQTVRNRTPEDVERLREIENKMCGDLNAAVYVKYGAKGKKGFGCREHTWVFLDPTCGRPQHMRIWQVPEVMELREKVKQLEEKIKEKEREMEKAVADERALLHHHVMSAQNWGK